MKVLIVVHGFPPHAAGGAEIYAHAHARTLHDVHGDEVFVLAREQDRSAPEYRLRIEHRDGLTIAWVNNTFRSVRSFAESYDNPAIGAVAAKLIDDFQPDVAHVHHLTCLSTSIVPALAERRIPIFFTLHDYWLMCHRGQLLNRDLQHCDGPGATGCHNCLEASAGNAAPAYAASAGLRAVEPYLPTRVGHAVRRIAGSLAARMAAPDDVNREERARLDHMRRVCREVTLFLAPSDDIRRRFIQFGIPAERMVLAPYGFDEKPFRTIARAPHERRLRIGFLGTLMVSKAPHLLLEAYRQLPPGSASLDVFGAPADYHGDGRYRRDLEPLVNQPGVLVHGPIDHAHVPQALAKIDVLVVPSVWSENSPLVIREAFMAGVPVVASRIGGIPEIVEDERNGLLFEPGDSADLQRQLMRLVRDPNLLPRLASGIPDVRSIEESVAFERGLYESSGTVRTRPSLAAIVLNYRTPDDTLLAVRSLLASRRPIDRIVVVNNDTASEDLDRLQALSSSVVLVHTGRNLGFSGGVNVGIRTALAHGAARILLVNSDVIVPPDCVERLERALTVSKAGIVGPVVLARSNPAQVASLGISYDGRTGRMKHRGFGGRTRSLDLQDHSEVAAISGCLMLIAGEVFESIGLFDEDYFFTFEDVAFCIRARRAGFSTLLAGSARAYHHGGRSLVSTSPTRLYYAARNHLLLAEQADPATRGLSGLARTGSILLLNVAHAIASTGAPWPTRLRAIARGTRDYLARRFGAESVLETRPHAVRRPRPAPEELAD